MEKILKGGLGRIMSTGANATSGKLSGFERRDVFMKNIFFYVSLPLIAIAGLCIMLDGDKKKEKQEFVPYEYLRIRKRKFPWGDGNTSLFHKERVNPSERL